MVGLWKIVNDFLIFVGVMTKSFLSTSVFDFAFENIINCRKLQIVQIEMQIET